MTEYRNDFDCLVRHYRDEAKLSCPFVVMVDYFWADFCDDLAMVLAKSKTSFRSK